MGQQQELTFSITNKSEELPISFSLPKIAHFKASPSKGKLHPLQSLDVVLTFAPKQVSTHTLVWCGVVHS